MTLMEKQDLMTANPARFTYRAAFGAEWCLHSQFGLPSFALHCPAPPHTVQDSLNQSLLWSKCSVPLAGETQDHRRRQLGCRSRYHQLEGVQDAPVLSHEHVWMGLSTTHHHVFHLHF